MGFFIKLIQFDSVYDVFLWFQYWHMHWKFHQFLLFLFIRLVHNNFLRPQISSKQYRDSQACMESDHLQFGYFWFIIWMLYEVLAKCVKLIDNFLYWWHNRREKVVLVDIWAFLSYWLTNIVSTMLMTFISLCHVALTLSNILFLFISVILISCLLLFISGSFHFLFFCALTNENGWGWWD